MFLDFKLFVDGSICHHLIFWVLPMAFLYIKQILLLIILCLSVTLTASANEYHSTASSAQPLISQATISVGSDRTAFVSFEHIDGFAVFEGDIILGPSEKVSKGNGQYSTTGNAISTQYFLWNDNTIPYQISSSISSQTTIDRIRTAITHWQDKTQLKFVELTATNAAKYPDYIEFIASSGCSSYVGRQGGKQNIWVGPYCTSGNIIHEIGHAIGLFHEHTRSDRDDHVTINWGNITEGKSHNFSNQSSSINLGPYDYASIMHYGAYSFSKNGQRTITVKNTGSIGQRVALSTGDIAAVNAHYGSSLEGSISHDSSLVEPNNPFSIQLSLLNQGVANFPQVGINVQLPNDVQYDSYVSQSSWVCTESESSTLQCIQPDQMPPGTGKSLTLNLIAPEYGYPLTFTAQFFTDKNTLEKSLNITVNSNNFPPNIIENQEIIAEIDNLYDGKSIGIIEAEDPNLDSVEFYEIVSGNSSGVFSLDNQTGELTIADTSVVSTTTMTYSLAIQASDYELMSETENISVRLIDADDVAQPNSSSSSKSGDSGGGASDFCLLLILLMLCYQKLNRGTASNNCEV